MVFATALQTRGGSFSSFSGLQSGDVAGATGKVFVSRCVLALLMSVQFGLCQVASPPVEGMVTRPWTKRWMRRHPSPLERRSLHLPRQPSRARPAHTKMCNGARRKPLFKSLWLQFVVYVQIPLY